MKMRASLIIACWLLSFSAHAGVLDDIKERGFVKCAVNNALFGFSIQDKTGRWQGFDVEFCRALAAAVFGDPEKIEFRGVTAKERFAVLAAGEVDVLYRNSTWTMTRDTSLGVRFAGINYYDGQGYMVKVDKGINSAYELSGSRLCITEGTTSEKNSVDFFNYNNMQFEIVSYQDPAATRAGFEAGDCDVISVDQSQLYSQRLNLKEPDSAVILPEIISKEPLGPAIKTGDDQWFDVVQSVLNLMIEAEFLDIKSGNVSRLRVLGSSEQKRLLSEEGLENETLGLDPLWALNVITLVGNYGEVFERTIGASSPLKIARGLNAQWNNGGILYSKSIR